MSDKHTYRFTYSQEAQDGTVLCELEAEVHFRFTPGRPARIRYDENDHPAEGPEIDIYDVRVERRIGIKSYAYVQTSSTDEYETLLDYAMDHCFDEMVESATEDEEAARDDAAEHAAAVRREIAGGDYE